MSEPTAMPQARAAMPQAREATPGRLDPVDYSVITSSLSGIVREMQQAIFRSGYSTAIRESQELTEETEEKLKAELDRFVHGFSVEEETSLVG